MFQQQWLTAMNDQQAGLVEIQRQISTGKRIATSADDPVGAMQVVRLQAGLDRIENFSKNGDVARRALALEESTLGQVVDVLDRVRELAIQSGGTATTVDARANFADEARQLLNTLMDLSNVQDADGRFVFSGNKVHNQPFSMVGGTVSYSGDDGIRSERISDNRTVQENDSGESVFQAIRNGNGTFSVQPGTANSGSLLYKSAVVSDPSAWVRDDYTVQFSGAGPFTYQVVDSSAAVVSSGAFTPGDTISFLGAAVTFEGMPADGDTFDISASRNQDIFRTVQNFVASLGNSLNTPTDQAQAQSDLNSALLDLDRALEHIGMTRGRVGTRLALIDEQMTMNSDIELQLSQSLSSVRDVDYASAISELQTRMFGLEAVQKTFESTSSFSLFDLI